MYKIIDVLAEETISETYFECDLTKCKGACCTFPGQVGAPLKEKEIKIIEEILPIAMEYLPAKHVKLIKEKGFVQGSPSEYTTQTVEAKACCFVYFEGDIALCALEKAFRDGKTNFKKPISCHLFPIRIGDFGGDYLYYDKFDVCKPALPNGKKRGIKIHESVKEALIREYGEEWYDEYLNIIKKKD